MRYICLMNDANVRLSPEELALASDAGVMLTKNNVIAKVYELFGSIAELQQKEILAMEKDLETAIEITPKISRGEGYLGLPYVILDYPRYFRPHDVFAIRTMFWWGNFFSVTLHMKGNYREHFQEKLIGNYALVKELGFHACIGPDEWEHHFGDDNYLSVDMIDEDEWLVLYSARDFTKLALKFPISGFNEMKQDLMVAYKSIIRLLAR